MPKSPLDDHRAQLDQIDGHIVDLIARRLDICRDVARVKKVEGICMMQPGRVELVKRRVAERARARGLDETFARNLYSLIIDEACRLEDVIIASHGKLPAPMRASLRNAAGSNGDMSETPLSQRAVILGVNGLVGRLLARHLVESGAYVSGLDLQEAVVSADLGIDYTCCDATSPGPREVQMIGAADAVFICLPEEAAMRALPGVLQTAHRDALIVDTLSVKQRIAALLKSLRPAQEYLSINLMFSPKIGFSGQNVALVRIKHGPRAEEFAGLLAAWGATAVEVQAEEHDRLTALIQVVTHAALLSIGQVLSDWGYDIGKGIAMATPPHRICLALLARISDASPEVYWDIQESNTFARAARRALAERLAVLSEIVEADREDAFREVVARIGGMLEPLKKELLDCAGSISAASSVPAPPICR
jgi:chorismate mutase-like protein